MKLLLRLTTLFLVGCAPVRNVPLRKTPSRNFPSDPEMQRQLLRQLCEDGNRNTPRSHSIDPGIFLKEGDVR
jgi:hypothetical protein